MKFWVKVVNDTFQEQLLVDASCIEELHSQLQTLLNVGTITRMSITDFHSQVTLKLNDGADIINVRIECGPGAAPSHEAPGSVSPRPHRRLSGSVNSQTNGDLSFNQGHSLSQGREAPSPHTVNLMSAHVNVLAGGRHERENSLGASTGHHTLAGSPFAGSGSHQNSPGTQTPRSNNNNSQPNSGALHRTSSGKGLLDATDNAPIERVVIKRADLASMMDTTFSNAFNETVSGCFVRLREANLGSGAHGGGYMVAQIVHVHSSTQILVDLVHFAELRQLDVVSNSPPSVDEIRAWHRKMIASSRTVPSVVFIEAKAEALEGALRSVASLTTPSPPSSNIGGATGQTPPSMRRRATIYGIHQQREEQHHRPLVGKPLVSTNDTLLNCSITKSTDEGHCWCVFATRHSNARCKHSKPSDFSACVITFNDDFTKIIEDRDVSAKSVVVSNGPPQLWNGYFHCAAHTATEVLCANSHHNYDAPADHYVALVGRDIKALYNTQIPFAPPITPWGNGGTGYLPQFLVVGEVLHMFYLVAFVDGNGMKVSGLAHAVTTDAKLQKWFLVSQEGPLVCGVGGAVFHASTFENVKSPTTSDGTTAARQIGIRILFCSNAHTETPNVTLLQNSDDEVSERSWTPVPAVCSIPQGDWRAHGVQSIALFSYGGNDLYAAVNGTESHKHSSLYVVPLITS